MTCRQTLGAGGDGDNRGKIERYGEVTALMQKHGQLTL